MSIEREIEPKVFKIKTPKTVRDSNIRTELSSQVTGLRGGAMLFEVHALGPFMRYGLENILAGADVTYENNFANDYIEGIKEGYLPIVVGNHQSHVDGISLALPVRILTNVANEKLPQDQKLKGFALVLASSLYSGHQGAMMKGFFDETYPLVEKRKLVPILHTRPQDKQRYNMKTERLGQFKDLIDTINEGYAVAVFPEGTTTAGKKNKEGKPNGMQKFMPSSVRMLIAAAKEANKKAMIIPVSITGGPNIHNPDTKLPTLKALKAGFNLGDSNLIHIYVSNPIKADKGELEKLYRERNWDGLNNAVARTIAKHLPERERGFYS